MNCPQCSKQMEAGIGRVRGTMMGFLFYGFSHQHFWFVDGNDHRTLVLYSGDETPAYRCPSCQTVVVPGHSGN